MKVKISFNPRALTSPDGAEARKEDIIPVSIHGLLRALTEFFMAMNPPTVFQSTGSYEP